MKRTMCLWLLLLAAFGGSAVAHEGGSDGYAIQSLNLPDPIFVIGGDGIQIRVTAGSSEAARRAAVRLNGDEVTSALAETEPGVLTGTVFGLQPGINSLEVFKSRRDRHPEAGLKVARAKAPSVACSLASFPASALPVPNTVVTSAAPVAAAGSVPAHCLVVGTINAGRVGTPTPTPTPATRYTYAINWQARLPDAWNSKFHMPGGGGTDGSVPRHHRTPPPRLRGRSQRFGP